jgi:hypothetical protein
LAALVVGASDAAALDGEATSDSSAQAYDVRSPTGETILTRRRFTTTLGLGAYDLLGASQGDPRAPELSLRLRLRYDADYGTSASETDPTQTSSFVPGLTPGLVDLMYGYLEGRRFLGGWAGFKLGRQYMTDVLGWWSFDGGEVSVTTPYYVKAELYGGLEQRGGLPLSTSRFEADGVWRGDRSSFTAPASVYGGAVAPAGSNVYPAFQSANIAPAIGAALESTGVSWLHARLTYRRVYNTGTSNTADFATGLAGPTSYSGARISSERLGYAVDANMTSVGGAKAGIVYDLYRSEITSAYASLDAYVAQKVTLSADYDFYQPAFDGDSIWNFFAGSPRNDLGVRANAELTRHLSIGGGAHVRIFSVQTSPFNPFDPASGQAYSPSTLCAPLSATAAPCGTVYPTNAYSFDEGGSLSARWRTGDTRIVLHGTGDFGDQGNRVGGDLSGEHTFETRYLVGARAGVWHWKDDLRPDRATTSFQYVANVGYRFLPRCSGSVEWEHDINSLVGQRFRVLFVLSLAVSK